MTERQRLLVVTGTLPWPTTGGFSLRVANLVERLAEWWDLSLVVTSDRPLGEPPWSRSSAHEVHFLHRDWRWADFPGRDARRGPLGSTVDEILDQRAPSAVLLFYGTEFLAFGRDDFPTVVGDRIDCFTLERLRKLRTRPGAIKRAILHASYERRLVRELDATTVVGEDDARLLRTLSGSNKVVVVPNGVHAEDAPRFDAEHPQPTVVFSGTLSYYANTDAISHFVRASWPGIRRRVPAARLVIAGRDPNRSVLELGGLPGVEIRRDVVSMSAVLQEAWVAVAPMRTGTGIKNKVLEAWAVGRPAVLTRRATNGLRIEGVMHELVAASQREFGDRVVELLRDQTARHRYGEAAQALARTHHSWRASAEAVSGLLRAGVGGPETSGK